jgi:hypothetical protein
MMIVVVGDRAKIEPELKKLNLDGIEYRDAEAKRLQQELQRLRARSRTKGIEKNNGASSD